MRVGIEVGGTFTDLVAIDGDRVTVGKVSSTPTSPDMGAFAAEQFQESFGRSSHGSELTPQIVADGDRCEDSRGASTRNGTFVPDKGGRAMESWRGRQ